ncbi:MAG: histone deacetylase family protein [Sulfuricella sp.]|nr:histone deacetylase family protein [Sulfuricella sp.]
MHSAYISHPACLKHDMGSIHPECPARLRAIEDQLISTGLMHFLNHQDAPRVTDEQLLRVHPQSYLDWVREQAPVSGLAYLDGDTAMCPDTLEAAYRAAGAVVRAVDMVMKGEVENAFCAIRPPGHHAESARAMGFCIFNNVAVGVKHAIAAYGLERIAIADFDVHHGNGTEQIFHDDPRVMLCSTFQHPFYPHCGADSGNEHIINVPLPGGSDGPAFRDAVEKHWLPALERFQPQMIFVSAGFDAHWEDDMGQFKLRESDYVWVTNQLKKIAVKYAHERIVSVLEGGYELHALGRSVVAHVKALSEL